MSRKSDTKLNTFVCPFADRCECRVKFRITATLKGIKLESQGEHSAQSHASDKMTKFLTLPQTAAVQQIVSTNPMVNATTVRRGTQLLSDEAGRISPSKSRLVARAVTAHRSRVLEPFTQGEKLDGDEGSLTRLSEKIFLRTLVEEHNAGGEHLQLHKPVCVGHQFQDGVVFGCYSTPMLLLHSTRGINSEWPFLAGFDTTFGITSKKFELMGISINSLRRKANPVCLCIVKKEDAIAYEMMYNSMEGGVFELVHNMKICKQSKHCEMCDAVREQIEQAPMQTLLTPPKPAKKKKGAERSAPFKFVIPLEKPMCDNTTKFSGWIIRKKPHLKDSILQCGAHLTGIAWQKRSHTRYFQDQETYRKFYKLVVRCLRCSTVALANILQMKLVQWLRSRDEPRAADWFDEYWTGPRGHYMLAHCGVGGTNNNCGVEGGWNGVKKEICGTAGSTSSLAVRCVVPSLLRFLGNKSKEEASYWRADTKARHLSLMFSFPSLPVPTKEEWRHLDALHPNILQLCTVFARPDTKVAWNSHIEDMLEAAGDEGVLQSAVHIQIRALSRRTPTAKPPPRSNFSHIIMPSRRYLHSLDPHRQMTVADFRENMHDDVMRFDEMLSNPAEFHAKYPTLDAGDFILLHESFCLLEPLEERWGRWVSWKCMCESFFSNAICEHSALMELMYDHSIEFPTQWSTQQLPGSASKKKRPSAWAEIHAEEDIPTRTDRWAPRLLGGDDMIITKTLKVHP